MSTRKQKAKAAAKLARIEAGKVLAGAKPEPAPASAPLSLAIASAQTESKLTPEQERLLNEIVDLGADINRLFHRAALKMMIEGLKAGLSQE